MFLCVVGKLVCRARPAPLHVRRFVDTRDLPRAPTMAGAGLSGPTRRPAGGRVARDASTALRAAIAVGVLTSTAEASDACESAAGLHPPVHALRASLWHPAARRVRA